MKILVDGPNGGKLLRHSKLSASEIASSFWGRVMVGNPDDCWPWSGGTNNGKRSGTGSYGVVWFNGLKFKTHRLAYAIAFKDPGELLVCHSCDNPICCNPSHLFLGTDLDNSRDCASKGRARREKGEERYNARLKESDVRLIRSKYIPRVYGIDQLASEFRVTRSMIYAIVTRSRWKHID